MFWDLDLEALGGDPEKLCHSVAMMCKVEDIRHPGGVCLIGDVSAKDIVSEFTGVDSKYKLPLLLNQMERPDANPFLVNLGGDG